METFLTFGEYHQRRNALLAKIQAAKADYKRFSDPMYTQLVHNGLELIAKAKQDYEQQLVALNATWNLQQSKKENR